MGMEKGFQIITEGIYRLKVPFDDIYTSVFLIRTKQGNALVDCATYDSDVDEIIISALKDLGLSLHDIKYLILTHNHGDHAGGAKRIIELNPNVEIVENERPLSFDGITVYGMKGHTLGCIGVLDARSGTLIAGDGLQGYCVGKYKCYLESKEEYLKTIEKIRKDQNIKNILFSHAYEPWNRDYAFGRAEIEQCLEDCMTEARRYHESDSHQ